MPVGSAASIARIARPGREPDRSPWSLTGPLARRHRARIVGAGPDLVVFSHGLGTDQRSWGAIAPFLPARFAALLFDLPGAGPTLPADFDPHDYRSLAAYADDILALLDELGVTRCTFVGHSVSGMLGLLAAVEAPELFRQIVLLNASPRYLNDAGYHGGFDRAALDALFDAMATNYQAWVAGFAPAAVGADVPAAVADFAAGLLAMRPHITARTARMIFESDMRPVLGAVRVPTTLIHSRRDIAVPQSVAAYLQENIADARLIWIDAVGHLPHLSAPNDVLRALASALA